MSELKRTPLHAAHVELGAKMVEFAGWHMPVQYRGLVQEHQSVRRAAGVFDVSHMGEFTVGGRDAEGFLQYALTNNAARLAEGRSQYTLMCDQAGGVMDDAMVYRIDGYLLVVNAANAAADWRWLSSLAEKFDVRLKDRSDDYALLAVQGPHAEAIMQPICDVDLGGLRRTRICAAVLAGRGVLIGRTGYTGEDGFEVFCAHYDAARLWDEFLRAGAMPAGLGARNTLRLEAGMALHGHELSREINPYEAGLGGTVDLNKGDFVGRSALEAVARGGPTRRLVGLKMKGRAIPRDGYPVRCAHGPGKVTSGTFSPTLEAGIAMAFLPPAVRPGEAAYVDVRGAEWEAEVAELPFYSRVSKWRARSQ